MQTVANNWRFISRLLKDKLDRNGYVLYQQIGEIVDEYNTPTGKFIADGCYSLKNEKFFSFSSNKTDVIEFISEFNDACIKAGLTK